MRNPQPSDAELAAIYSETYFLGSDDRADQGAFADQVHALKRATAIGYLDRIENYRGWTPETRRGRTLLEVGSGLGNLLVEARARGYVVTGLEYAPASVARANARLGEALVRQGSLESLAMPPASFDVCVLADVIEHTRDPMTTMVRAWELLKPGGTLFLATPSLDSWSGRLMRQRWLEFKLEHLFYFDERTVRTLLLAAGFNDLRIAAGRKTLSPDYVLAHFDRFPVPVLSPVGRAGRVLIPGPLRRWRLEVVASGIDVLASRTEEAPLARRRARLSVVLPVYNEVATFTRVMNDLLEKAIPGVDIEVVVIESRSSDGTREAVKRFEGQPRVRVIYQDEPRGKGHAVRAGLTHVTGDYVLIQDADLEYDINDYDSLLEPLRSGRAAFVLGDRHGNDGRTWKLRHFTDQVLVSRVMNLGHMLFTTLFNLVYGTRLRDPFTMYKVFRRDCISGLILEANRFDFDWELVGKLVRRGYVPLEIPVNYRSRSFSEGKKVRFIADPLTWVRACFKYRFARLDSPPSAGATERRDQGPDRQ